jgi:hypothetical protein
MQILSASAGSFSNRYRKALSNAAGMASFESRFNSNITVSFLAGAVSIAGLGDRKTRQRPALSAE